MLLVADTHSAAGFYQALYKSDETKLALSCRSGLCRGLIGKSSCGSSKRVEKNVSPGAFKC
jgi:hypothetical protein